MAKTVKKGDIVTIYFGDSMRKLLRKNLRKKNTFFVDYVVMSVDGDMLTVVPNARMGSEETPYEFSGICIGKNDRHLLFEGELDSLRESSKSELYLFAEEHEYNPKEFKEAIKPFRKGGKKDD
jgi:hypothetical protein